MKDRQKTRIGIATFFILCGLIIGIVGGYGCVAIKHYEMSVTDPRVSLYSEDISYDPIATMSAVSLEVKWVNIETTKRIEGLPYTTQSKFLWLPAFAGLAYIILGVWSLIKKDFLFQKDGIK